MIKAMNNWISQKMAPEGKVPKLLFIFGLLSACVNFPEGYANSYPNTAHLSFQNLINRTAVERGSPEGIDPGLFTWLWSTVLNIWFLGYLIGTFLTPYFTEQYGRKNSLLFANGLALIGALISLFSVILESPEMILISRVVTSCSTGISFGSLILFLQEVTATPLRGLTSFLSETAFILTTVGGVAFGMDAIFGKRLEILTGISIIPAVLGIFLILPLKETPKFLLINRKDRKAAEASLAYYHGQSSKNSLIIDEMLLEEDETVEMGILEGIQFVWSEPHLRKAFIIGCLCLQVIVSLWPICYLSTDILKAQFNLQEAQEVSLYFIVCNFIASLLGMFMIERFGRRRLFLILGVLNTLTLCLYIFFDRMAVSNPEMRQGCIVALCLFGVTYGIGLGPIAFFITSELVVQRHRSLIQSMVFAVNTVVNCVFSFATLPLYNWINIWGFIPLFIIPSVFSLFYLYKNLPETKGREIHDIVEQLIYSEKEKVLLINSTSRTSTDESGYASIQQIEYVKRI